MTCDECGGGSDVRAVALRRVAGVLPVVRLCAACRRVAAELVQCCDVCRAPCLAPGVCDGCRATARDLAERLAGALRLPREHPWVDTATAAVLGALRRTSE